MSIINVDRAIHELRCGRLVNIDGQKYIHPEFINDVNWKEISVQNPRLIITGKRASMLLKEEISKTIEIDISKKSVDLISLIIGGAAKIEKSEKSECLIPSGSAALGLARAAALLPVLVAIETQEEAIEVNSEDITSFKANLNKSLKLVTDTKLNLKNAPSGASIKAFRPANGGSEHLAIIIGNPSVEPVIRVHSSCYTGDLIGSLACDCGDQLTECIKLMEKEGGGIILYLMQEGRGIGLINKLRAYNLQYDGMDTVEANEFLGFDDEEREFEPAALILKELGISSVSLVTNNPKKAKGLEELGINVKKLIPLIISHEHNESYLNVKAKKSGHLIEGTQNS